MHTCFGPDNRWYRDQLLGRHRRTIHARRCYHAPDGMFWEVTIATLRDGRVNGTVVAMGRELIFSRPMQAAPEAVADELRRLAAAGDDALPMDLRRAMCHAPIQIGDDDAPGSPLAPLTHGAPLADALFA